MNKHLFIPLFAILLIPIISATAISYDSPLKQSTSVSADMVQCNDGLVLIIKNSDGSPACVKPDTKAVLIERGWATEAPERDMMMMDDMMMDDMMMDDRMMMDDEMMMDDDRMMMDDDRMMMDDDRMMMDDEMMMNNGDDGDADTSMVDNFDTDVDPGEIDDTPQDGTDGTDSSMSGSSTKGEEMASTELVLTDEEMTWLENNKIKVVYDPAWEPMEFKNADGDLAGLSAKYLAKFTEVLGIEFEIIHVGNWSKVLESIKDKKSDMIMMVTSTSERLEYMDFTTPHTIIPASIISTTEGENISIDDLANLRVITVKDFSTESWLDANHPGIKYISVNDVSTAITYIESGIGDVYLGSYKIASYHAANAGATVYDAGDLGYEYKLSIGYDKDKPIMGAILEKTLASISEQQKEMMLAEIIQ